MEEIVDDYNSHLPFNGRPPDPRLHRFSSLFLLLLTALLCLPVLAVAASWLQWDAVTAGILGEMASTVLPGYVGTSLHLCCWRAEWLGHFYSNENIRRNAGT